MIKSKCRVGQQAGDLGGTEADEVWRQSAGEFPLEQGGQSFCSI